MGLKQQSGLFSNAFNTDHQQKLILVKQVPIDLIVSTYLLLLLLITQSNKKQYSRK